LVIERGEDGGAVVLSLFGEVDLTNQWVLADAILQTERESDGAMVVDVQNIDYIDAGGLRVLLHAARRAHSSGTSFALRRPDPLLRRLLRVTGLDSTIAVLPQGA